MPATATSMVKAIWARYFQIGSAGEAAAIEAEAAAAAAVDAAPAAQAVEEVLLQLTSRVL